MGTLILRCGFEAAHRLPALGGKCASVHGHSWTVEVTLSGPVDKAQGIIADAGELKHELRDWIDAHLDHACLLGDEDPLIPALRAADCRVYLFGQPGTSTVDLPWPTTEAVAALLHRVARKVWEPWPSLEVERVLIGEAPSIGACFP